MDGVVDNDVARAPQIHLRRVGAAAQDTAHEKGGYQAAVVAVAVAAGGGGGGAAAAAPALQIEIHNWEDFDDRCRVAAWAWIAAEVEISMGMQRPLWLQVWLQVWLRSPPQYL